MRRHTPILVSLVLVAALAGGAPTANTSRAAAASAVQIDVTGEGVVHAPPDVARLTLGVEVSGPNLTATDANADQKISALVRMLRSAGVSEGHIRTAELQIEPQYDTRDGQPILMRGYIVRNMLEVETSDLGGLSALIDAAMAGGANRLDDIRFETRALAGLQGQARERAWQSARAKGEQLAQKAGLRLGGVVHVEEPLVEAISTVRADPSPGAPGIVATDQASLQRGEIEVLAQVRIVWSATQ